MEKKNTHGGKRKGAGRPKKYICEMENLTLYIPVLAEKEIVESVRKISDKYKKTK